MVTLMNGPPFSLDNDEINGHYQGVYSLDRLESIAVAAA